MKCFRLRSALLMVPAFLCISVYHVTVTRLRPYCNESAPLPVPTTGVNSNAPDFIDARPEALRRRWVPSLYARASRRNGTQGRPVYLRLSTAGRLGNRLFSYASLLGIAIHHGFVPLKNKDELSDILQVTSDIANESLANMKIFKEQKCCTFDPRVLELSPDHNWTIHGFYQSWKYFHHIRDVVRSEFRFKGDILKKVEAFFRELGHFHRPKVGVHMRRGDMTTEHHIKKGYTVANISYYFHAMDYFRQRLTNPLFVVISDDMNYAKRELSLPDVTFAHNSPVVDLAVLSHCNHVIMSTGTFGWWGAWLAGGAVVYYKNFPLPGSFMGKEVSVTDHFPPEWIAME